MDILLELDKEIARLLQALEPNVTNVANNSSLMVKGWSSERRLEPIHDNDTTEWNLAMEYGPFESWNNEQDLPSIMSSIADTDSYTCEERNPGTVYFHNEPCSTDDAFHRWKAARDHRAHAIQRYRFKKAVRHGVIPASDDISMHGYLPPVRYSRARRNKYVLRAAVACKRPRIQGRFLKREEVIALENEKNWSW